MSYESISNNI